MDVSNNENVWTCDKFIDLKREFLAGKNAVVAFDILQRLVNIESEDVDENAWLECKSLIMALLENIPMEVMLLSQQVSLLQAINNSPDNVVSTLANFYAKKEETIPLLRRESVAISIAFARRINSTETFESISKLLAPLLSQKEVYEELFHQLKNNNGSEHRSKIYQTLLEAVKRSTFEDSLLPFFDFILEDITGNDILMQLATIEFLTDLAIVNREGAKLIHKTGIVKAMHLILVKEESSPDGGFLFTATIKFFGYLSHFYPEIMDAVPEIINIILHMMQNVDALDPSQRALIAETFSHLTFTSEAKTKLAEKLDKEILPNTFRKLCVSTRIGPVELRSRFIDSITTIFEDVTEEQFAQWLGWAPELPAILTEYLTRPFPEIKLSAVNLLTIILIHEKGVELMLSGRENIEKFKEWLCDRNSEKEWNICQLKNDLIRSLQKANWSCIDSELKERLTHYFDTPRAQVEVATLEL